MATIHSSRLRIGDAELQALASIEPELRASDQTWRRKYLRDFAQAFRTYESILAASELSATIASASIILVGDYHALPACQLFVAQLLNDISQNTDCPVVLAVETIFSRDQHILDAWWRGEIDEIELRERIRFDLDWGYDWHPFYKVLTSARSHADGIFALDCMPREDLRKISIRDRHAAHKLSEIRDRHPNAKIVALVGESHLAPTHLPALVNKLLPDENALTILQNVDALYFEVSRDAGVEAVRIDQSTVCVFNSTPLEKYDSYRQCLDRWQEERPQDLDFAPIVYELIENLLRFLGISRNSPRNRTQPQFLVDLLPEIYDVSQKRWATFLERSGLSRSEINSIADTLRDRGCLYLPQFNAFAAARCDLDAASFEAARFVHHACQGLPGRSKSPALREDDRSQIEKVEAALAVLGSRVLNDRKSELNQESLSALGNGLYRAHLQGGLTRSDLKRLFLFPVNEPGKAAELSAHLHRRLAKYL